MYDLYLEAFEQCVSHFLPPLAGRSSSSRPPYRIRRFPVIKDLEDNDRFCEFMQSTLDKHRVVIPDLAIGFVSALSPLASRLTGL